MTVIDTIEPIDIVTATITVVTATTTVATMGADITVADTVIGDHATAAMVMDTGVTIIPASFHSFIRAADLVMALTIRTIPTIRITGRTLLSVSGSAYFTEAFRLACGAGRKGVIRIPGY